MPSDKLAKARMKYELFLVFNRSIIAVVLFYAAQTISFPQVDKLKAFEHRGRENHYLKCRTDILESCWKRPHATTGDFFKILHNLEATLAGISLI